MDAKVSTPEMVLNVDVKGERESEAEVGIARGRQMQTAGVENKRTNPVWPKRVLVAHHQLM